jgi:hypothetical protein
MKVTINKRLEMLEKSVEYHQNIYHILKDIHYRLKKLEEKTNGV